MAWRIQIKMEEKDFIDYYRMVAEQGISTPHNGHWNDSPMDSDIDDVWNNVSLELDIDDVWKNVSKKLDEDKRRKSISIIIAWSSAAVIFFLIGLFIFEKNVENKLSSQIVRTEQALKKTNDKTTAKANGNSIESKANISNYHQKLESIFSSNDTKNDSIIDSNKIVDSLIQEDLPELRKNINGLNITNLAALDLKEANRMISSLPKPEAIPDLMYYEDKIPPISSTYSIKGRFSIGVSNAIKNTWLINRETKEGFNRNDLKTTKLRFLPDIGINIKYTFSNKWSAEVSGFFSSSIGQSYNDYVYGDYSSKSITLKYASFEGSMKYSNYRIKKFKNIGFNSIVGLYFSRLRSARQTIAGDRESVYNQYRNLDYGFVLGQEVEFYILNRLSIAPGIRLKIGVPNVYRGYSEIPSSFHRTQNGSLDFRFSIYYKLYK